MYATKPNKMYKPWLRNVHVRRMYMILVYPTIYLPLWFIVGGLTYIANEIPDIKNSWSDK
jgi:hypothetical protein